MTAFSVTIDNIESKGTNAIAYTVVSVDSKFTFDVIYNLINKTFDIYDEEKNPETEAFIETLGEEFQAAFKEAITTAIKNYGCFDLPQFEFDIFPPAPEVKQYVL